MTEADAPAPYRSPAVPMAVAIPAVLFAAYAWAVVASTFWRPGAIGLNYNAPGSDWMVMWGAVHQAMAGQVAAIFDGDRFTGWLNATLGHWLSKPLEFRPWVYPPSFLVLLAPFEPLGFFGSYVAFQAVSAVLLGAALLCGPNPPPAARWLTAAVLLSPAASVNVVDGQCGLLVAALLVAGFRLLGPRPILAGAILGLLTFKPQFWVLVPVALVAAGRWRALAAAIASAGALALASAAIFGLESWVLWIRETLESLSSADPKWVTLGRIWGDSVYACAALLGLPAKAASALQFAAIAAAAAAVFAAYRSNRPADQKLAVLLAATLLAAPHSGVYDLVLVLIAVGLWLAPLERPALWHWILGLAFWLFAYPPILLPPGRALPLLLCGFIALVLWESRAHRPLQAPAPA